MNIWKFYKKRWERLCIPQYIAFGVSFLIMYIKSGMNGIDSLNIDILGTMISFLGLNYCDSPWVEHGVQTFWIIGEWYTTVIIIIMVLFPLLRLMFVNKRVRVMGSIIIVFLFYLNLHVQILQYQSDRFSISNIIMYFWLGMLFEEYKHLLTDKIACVVAIIAFIWVLCNPQSILGKSYLPCFIFSLLLFVCIYFFGVGNFAVKYFSKFNYEIYLIHHRIFIVIIPALVSNENITKSGDFLILFLLIFGAVCVFSEKLQLATDRCIGFIEKISNKDIVC